MNTAEKIAVMQAFDDGEEIQLREWHTELWGPSSTPQWGWDVNEFRIKPKPETLEDRVKAEYGGYEVVMLEWVNLGSSVEASAYLCYSARGRHNLLHTDAQSMKGWHKYVYCNAETNKLYALRDTYNYKNNVTIMPIAVLFEKVAG